MGQVYVLTNISMPRLVKVGRSASAPVRQEFLLRIDAPVFDQTRAGAA